MSESKTDAKQEENESEKESKKKKNSLSEGIASMFHWTSDGSESGYEFEGHFLGSRVFRE